MGDAALNGVIDKLVKATLNQSTAQLATQQNDENVESESTTTNSVQSVNQFAGQSISQNGKKRNSLKTNASVSPPPEQTSYQSRKDSFNRQSFPVPLAYGNVINQSVNQPINQPIDVSSTELSDNSSQDTPDLQVTSPVNRSNSQSNNKNKGKPRKNRNHNNQSSIQSINQSITQLSSMPFGNSYRHVPLFDQSMSQVGGFIEIPGGYAVHASNSSMTQSIDAGYQFPNQHPDAYSYMSYSPYMMMSSQSVNQSISQSTTHSMNHGFYPGFAHPLPASQFRSINQSNNQTTNQSDHNQTVFTEEQSSSRSSTARSSISYDHNQTINQSTAQQFYGQSAPYSNNPSTNQSNNRSNNRSNHHDYKHSNNQTNGIITIQPNNFHPSCNQSNNRSNRSNYRRGFCLFVFHLPHDIDDDELFALFAPFGDVLSARVMKGPPGGPTTKQLNNQSNNQANYETINQSNNQSNNQKSEPIASKGFGFVNFATFEQAQSAIIHRHGHKVGDKFLKVDFKQGGRV